MQQDFVKCVIMPLPLLSYIYRLISFKMAECVLKNNYFEFDRSVYQKVSGTTIGTKFAPPYACIFMDRLENDSLKT